MASPKPILYAEDDENDIFLMERSFGKLGIKNPLRVVPNGTLAVAYLAGTAPYQERGGHPLPCLVLLDLNLPGRHGLEVLQWIRGTPGLESLPVLIFSSSTQASDVQRAYQLGVDGFLMKPGDPRVLLNIVTSVRDYWLAETRPAMKFCDFGVEGNIPPPKASVA